MNKLGEFTFVEADALGPREDITFQGEGLRIRVFRRFRSEPFPHQPQQALNGAVLGWESILSVLDGEKPAAGYRFKLYKDGKFVQHGATDHDGIAWELAVDLTPGELKPVYRLVIFEPAKPRRRKVPA